MARECAGGEEVGPDGQSHRESARWGRTVDWEEMAHPLVALGPWTQAQCGARWGLGARGRLTVHLRRGPTGQRHGAMDPRACGTAESKGRAHMSVRVAPGCRGLTTRQEAGRRRGKEHCRSGSTADGGARRFSKWLRMGTSGCTGRRRRSQRSS
ncbi:hypothetical protein E2562_033124 [Oryza meyeriana var. granulata]|uniref:Uncharacterized protein n=1 Tax=Oryza meyeriana var. granulata TaxID=110450 RepID=A0A6G1CLX0_9ORYZ|nr:hypothetical protein E2562_033124 [Oryza meyeriana var. granulata]